MIRGGDKALLAGRIALLFAALGLATVASLTGDAAAVVLTVLASVVACIACVASAARALGKFIVPMARESAGRTKAH